MLLRSNPINFKAMEEGIKMLTKLHQNTEKLQEGQAASLNVLIKLQTQALVKKLAYSQPSFSRYPPFLPPDSLYARRSLHCSSVLGVTAKVRGMVKVPEKDVIKLPSSHVTVKRT